MDKAPLIFAIIPDANNFQDMFESLIWGKPDFQDFNCMDHVNQQRLLWLYEYHAAINDDAVDGELLQLAAHTVENLIEIDNAGYVALDPDRIWPVEHAQNSVFDLFTFHPALRAYKLSRILFDRGASYGIKIPLSMEPQADYSNGLLVRTTLTELPLAKF